MHSSAPGHRPDEAPVDMPAIERPQILRCRRSLDESGATASLELLALTPLLALLVLFVLWAGNSARAGLVADLAAEEAAVAAALCCDGAASTASADAALRREYMAGSVLASRPGLGDLCLRGPMPSGDRGFVTETEASFAGAPAATGFAHGARVIEVHFDCETDGTVAPLRGLFPTVTMHGRASEVTVFADGPQLTVTPAVAPEGDELVFVTTLNEATTAGIGLDFFTQDQSATSTVGSSQPDELDFDAIPEELSLVATIPAGGTTAEMRVATHDDNVCEGDETLLLVVSASGLSQLSTNGDEDVVRFTTVATITDETDCSMPLGR